MSRWGILDFPALSSNAAKYFQCTAGNGIRVDGNVPSPESRYIRFTLLNISWFTLCQCSVFNNHTSAQLIERLLCEMGSFWWRIFLEIWNGSMFLEQWNSRKCSRQNIILNSIACQLDARWTEWILLFLIQILVFATEDTDIYFRASSWRHEMMLAQAEGKKLTYHLIQFKT